MAAFLRPGHRLLLNEGGVGGGDSGSGGVGDSDGDEVLVGVGFSRYCAYVGGGGVCVGGISGIL